MKNLKKMKACCRRFASRRNALKMMAMVLACVLIFPVLFGSAAFAGENELPIRFSEVRYIWIITPPDRLIFRLGEELDLTGMEIKARLLDGTYVFLSPSQIDELVYDKTKAGIVTVTVACGDGEDTFEIEVVLSGDVNKDGVLNIFDIMMIRGYIFGKVTLQDFEIQSKIADVNEDAGINLFDIVAIRDHIFGKNPLF